MNIKTVVYNVLVWTILLHGVGSEMGYLLPNSVVGESLLHIPRVVVGLYFVFLLPLVFTAWGREMYYYRLRHGNMDRAVHGVIIAIPFFFGYWLLFVATVAVMLLSEWGLARAKGQLFLRPERMPDDPYG